MHEKNKIQKELTRKSIHAFFVIYAFIIITFPNNKHVITFTVVLLGAIYYFFEQLRLRQKKIPIFSQLAKMSLREKEKQHFAYAPLTLFIGIALSLELYMPPVAALSIIAVTIGDATAGLSGTVFYKSPRLLWNKKKTYVGMLTNALSIFLFCMLFFDATIKTILVTSISSAVVESLDLEHIDNLIIPLFVGAMLYITVFV